MATTTVHLLLLVILTITYTTGYIIVAEEESKLTFDELRLKKGHHHRGTQQHHQHQHHRKTRKRYVSVEPQNSYFHVNDDFISSAIDMAVFDPSVKWWKFDFKNARMKTLLQGLTPTTLRIGGSPADYLLYFRNESRTNATGIVKTPFVMPLEDWDNLVGLTLDTGARLLFDLNIQTRWGIDWDPANAMEIFNRCVEKGWGANIDWELGNESDGSPPGMGNPIPAGQVAKDFVSLRKLLNTYPQFEESRLVGPDIIGVVDKRGQQVLQAVANVGDSMTALTFHHYYFRGDIAKPEEYINPAHFGDLENVIDIVANLIANSSTPDLPMWIGETADAWHSGTANVSDRYISGFLWMDKLGVSAQKGVSLVTRQTFYGHNYGFLNLDMQPNPDYWLSYVHKKLVGTRVLQPSLVTSSLHDVGEVEYFRLYAHCTNPKAGYPNGSITMFALNMSPNMTEVVYLNPLLGPTLDMFLMEPSGADGLLSPFVAVNGVKLEMPDDTTMPALKPTTLTTEQGVKFPPLTFGFVVLNKVDVKLDMCASS